MLCCAERKPATDAATAAPHPAAQDNQGAMPKLSPAEQLVAAKATLASASSRFLCLQESRIAAEKVAAKKAAVQKINEAPTSGSLVKAPSSSDVKNATTAAAGEASSQQKAHAKAAQDEAGRKVGEEKVKPREVAVKEFVTKNQPLVAKDDQLKSVVSHKHVELKSGATTIQASAKDEAPKVSDEEAAAIKLQALQRGRLCRQQSVSKEHEQYLRSRTYKKLKETEEAMAKAKEEAAATKMQALQRGRSTRAARAKEKEAATKMQALQRGRAARAAMMASTKQTAKRN